MTYQETLAYLYNSAPLFQHIGKAAYKEGLESTQEVPVYPRSWNKRQRLMFAYISSNPSVRRLPCGTIYISSSGRFP